MNQLSKISVIILSSVIAVTQAQAHVSTEQAAYKPWYLTASIGMQSVQYAQKGHGETAAGRLAFHYMPIRYLGLELGIQSGNTMRFIANKETIDILGGVGIEGQIKPIIDVLLTAQSPTLSPSFPLYASAKAGMAYRQLQMDRESLNDISQTKPEFQVGLGYRLNPHLDISVMYQYMVGANPKIHADPLTESGLVSHIPAQQAVFLGLTYNLG